MRRALAAAVLVTAACGPSLRKYTVVRNGGVSSARGSCQELALAEVQGQLRVIPAGAAGCETVDGVLVRPGATLALWQIGSSPLAGPAISNEVVLKLPLLASGENERGLRAGEGQRGLISGENERGLRSGENERGLTSGENQRGLTSGENQRGLTSGENQRGLRSGDQARALAAGQGEKPVLKVTKAVDSEYATRDRPAQFTIRVRNIGASTLTRVIVIDRLAKELRVVDDGGAGVQPLPDGTALMIWTRTEPVRPNDEARPIEFRAAAR